MKYQQKEDGDYILVDCKSGHYDEHSHFVQSKFSCWAKDEDGKLIISDSKGLITLPEEFGTYPYEIGAVTKYSKDVELGNKYEDIQRCFYTECLRNVMALNLGIERVHGHGRPTTELPMAIVQLRTHRRLQLRM